MYLDPKILKSFFLQLFLKYHMNVILLILFVGGIFVKYNVLKTIKPIK